MISGPVSCVAGASIQVQLQAHTVATANQRYDVGYFIALNGNDARTGDCYHDYLSAPLSKVTNGMNSPYYSKNLQFSLTLPHHLSQSPSLSQLRYRLKLTSNTPFHQRRPLLF